jgi:hypothetical protein
MIKRAFFSRYARQKASAIKKPVRLQTEKSDGAQNKPSD